jgi:PAS domain S-box-containing protein
MKKLLVLANFLVALLLCVVIGLQTMSDRASEIERAYEELNRTTAALGEHTQQALTAIDLGVQSVLSQIQPNSFSDPLALETINSVLKNRQAGSNSTFVFYIFDPDARLLATSSPVLADLVLPNAPAFVAHAQRSNIGLYIDSPIIGVDGSTSAGQWVVNLTRRIDNPDGTFGGVVGADLSLEYLSRVYNELLFSLDSIAGVVRRDGIVLLRSPFDPSQFGRDVSQVRGFGLGAEAAANVAVSDASRYESPGSITAYRYVWNGGLVIYASRLESEVLADWHDRFRFKIGVGALAYALFAAVSIGSVHYIRRRDIWQEEQARRLRLLAESSAALVNASTLEELLERFANLAKSLTGASKAIVTLDEEGPFDAANDAQKLIVPIQGLDECPLGAIALKGSGDAVFSEKDRLEVQQLSSITGLLLENLQVVAARETALRQSKAAQGEIETIFSSISDGVCSLDRAWRFTFLNEQAERLFGRDRDELLGHVIWDEFPEAVGGVFESEYRRARTEGIAVSFEQYFVPLDIWLSVRVFPHDKGLTIYFRDTTKQRETESRLRQSQKMDAIGQLTGGIAHDFNNLLTVILGNADVIEEYLVDAPALIQSQASVIRRAGERAAELTHRLLAFARRQPLDPRRTNVNALIADIEEMMRRTLSESYDIELVRGAGIWKAIVDPHELENAILNLAINARDAMPHGGKLTIETCNSAVDADYAAINEMEPGQYVVIAVSDTGSGMTNEVKAKAFDPFFTTKPEGKGSGLGLSMVFGFASQSGGLVKIYSELGQGTTVKIYLPRALDNVEVEYQRVATIEPIKRGSERILLVEDDELVLQHTARSLTSLGYKVTECSTGEDAVKILREGKVFDMMLTDVVLGAGLSGKQVAVQAVDITPSLKVLFMSGYTENAIVHHGRLDRGVSLLNKPFRLSDLARKVRLVLDS